MNKKRVNDWLLKAREALAVTGIARDGTVESGYRSQISMFGAAVVTGSLPAAVAFFAERGSSSIERPRLLQAMYYCISDEVLSAKEIMAIVCKNHSLSMRDQFIDASIALKLAMNFYELVQRSGTVEES